jgi:preprotein translocase subunit SecG
MYIFLLTLLILDGLLLSVVVLLQAGQGGGLASLGGGSSDNMLSGRHATNLLTQLSWGLGAGLMVLSLLLSVVAANRQSGLTDVQRQLQTGPQSLPIAPLSTEPSSTAPVPNPTPEASPPPAPNP